MFPRKQLDCVIQAALICYLGVIAHLTITSRVSIRSTHLNGLVSRAERNDEGKAFVVKILRRKISYR